MKSVLIWFTGTMAGALAGYGLSYLFTEISMILLIVAGLIFGSSVAITINIHRDREQEHPK